MERGGGERAEKREAEPLAPRKGRSQTAPPNYANLGPGTYGPPIWRNLRAGALRNAAVRHPPFESGLEFVALENEFVDAPRELQNFRRMEVLRCLDLSLHLDAQCFDPSIYVDPYKHRGVTPRTYDSRRGAFRGVETCECRTVVKRLVTF